MIKSVQTVAVVMRRRNGNDPIGCGFGAGRASEFDISCDRLMSSTYSEKVLTSWGKRRCHIVRGIAIALVTVTDCIGVSYADDAPAWGLFRPATCWRPELAKTKPALSSFSSSFPLFFFEHTPGDWPRTATCWNTSPSPQSLWRKHRHREV